MPVLASAVVSKAGRPLVARQFNPNMSRSRLESLLLSFPKLIPAGAQHTSLLSADGSVRYVYMPIDDLYCVLLTPPLSNILQDIDTLHLLGRIVTEMCSVGSIRGGVGESEVLRNAFELLSAFDEVISMGYRERVGMTEVRAAMEMESHEERIQEIIARNKEQEAKEELKRRAKQLEMQRREALRRGQNPYGPGGPGMGGSGGSGGFDRPYAPPAPPPVQNVGGPEDRYGGLSSQQANKPFKGKGMQLGGKGAKNKADLLDALGGAPVPEEAAPLMMQQEPSYAAAPSPTVATPTAPAALAKPENPFGPIDEEEVHLAIREKLSLALNRDGGLDSLELKGDLDLRISSADVAKVVLQLSHSDNFTTNDLQFKTHPRIDKKAWTDSKMIQLRDTKQAFPVRTGLAVLKWRMTSKDESIVPLSINCWPSPSDNGTMDVIIEYELVSEDPDIQLKNIIISIPLPGDAYPGSVTAAEGTSWSLDDSSHALNWLIPELSQENEDTKSGTLEFNVTGDDVGAFFPVAVDFAAQPGLCGIKVDSVKDAASGEDVLYSTESLVTTEDFVIV